MAKAKFQLPSHSRLAKVTSAPMRFGTHFGRGFSLKGPQGILSLKFSDGNVQYGKGTASELSHTEGLHLSGAVQG